jgi:predicted dehydrogenase
MAHEHYRWQAPVRMFKSLLPKVGTPFFVRLSSRRHWSEAGRRRKELLPHALNEMGSHLLDCIRYLFGEVARIEWCRLHSPDHNAPGETGFTIALQTEGGATCIVDESSASYRATSGPKHVLIEVDGERGSLLLREGSTIEWTGPRDSWAMVVPVDKPSWSEERLAVINGGILAIQRHWLDCLRNRRLPETSVFDNLLSLELVFGARQAAATAKPFVPRREFRV